MKFTNLIALTLVYLSASCQKNIAPEDKIITKIDCPNIALPEFPHGIYINAGNHPYLDSQKDALMKYVIADSTNDGANIVIPWSKCDLGNGKYDWTYVLESAKPWWEAKKKVNLLIWTAVEVARQQQNGENMTPEYVRKKLTMIPVEYDEGDYEIAPFWEEAHRTEYKKFIKAIIDRFQDEPRIGFFRFGFGVGAENYPANKVPTPTSPNTPKFEKAGFTTTVWRNHVFSMMDYLASLKSKKPIFATMNDVYGDDTYYLDFAKKAQSHGFGIGMQGLTANAILLTEKNERCYADWCNVYPSMRGKVPLEAQTATNTNPKNETKQGNLGPQLTFAMDRGVQLLELYPFEWFVANNPTNPFHKEFGKEYREILKRVHEQLNCR